MNDKKELSMQKNMLYNTVGTITYYFCQWVLTVLIVRISGLEIAGYFSLATTFTAAPAILALFNFRSYQVSDLENRFSDRVYVAARIVTCILSMLVCLAAAWLYKYDAMRISIIMAYMLLKAAEGFVDVYYGIDQKKARMDIICYSSVIRGFGCVAMFLLGILVFDNLLVGILLMVAFSVVVIVCYDMCVTSKFFDNNKKIDMASIKSVIITCLPLAAVAFLNNYSISVPRIFLERYAGSEIMAAYTSVSSPTVVIQLAATTLFAPFVTPLTAVYVKGDKKGFADILKKMGILVLGASVLCLVLAKLLGNWGLVLIFGNDIKDYTYLFVAVVVLSILIGINASLFSICTLQRVMLPQLVIGITGMAISFISSIILVKKYEMEGVIIATFLTLLVQIAIQAVIVFVKWKSMKMETEENI